MASQVPRVPEAVAGEQARVYVGGTRESVSVGEAGGADVGRAVKIGGLDGKGLTGELPAVLERRTA